MTACAFQMTLRCFGQTTSVFNSSCLSTSMLTAYISWGNIRRFPTVEERNRTGGAGIYYHVRPCAL